MTETRPIPEKAIPFWLVNLIAVLITISIPLLLILLNARLLMTNAYLRWEYNRPNFPADPYGMTREQRLEYAPLALAYLFNDEGIAFLSTQTFPDGSPLYNERELSHMEDVKAVTQDLLRFGYGLIAGFALCVVALALRPASRLVLFRALFRGSALTASLIIIGLIAVATSFDWLFTQFHALFFEGTSWIFPYSDTLIRLFPLQFWVDAFALVFGSALIEALSLGTVMGFLMRRHLRPGESISAQMSNLLR